MKLAVIAVLAVTASCCWAQAAAPTGSASSFAPFEEWMGAVLTGDAATLKALYSPDPPAKVRVKTVMHDADADTSFWLGLKARNMKVEMVRSTTPKPDITHLILRVDVVTGLPKGLTVSVTNDQVW